MNIVYLVRPGDRNEELRYSLRSLSHFGDFHPAAGDRIYIAGHQPEWVHNVVHVATAQKVGPAHKQANAAGNLAAVLQVLVAEDAPFLLMNDDFYICQPVDRMPVLHRGPLEEVMALHTKGRYATAMRQTAELLHELGLTEDLLSYELHVPMVFSPVRLTVALHAGSRVPGLQYRTLYGNLFNIGGQQLDDVKLYTGKELFGNWPYLSSNDSLPSHVLQHLQRLFPDPSLYENGPLPAPARVAYRSQRQIQ